MANKEELRARAEELNLDVDENATKSELQDAVDEAEGNGDVAQEDGSEDLGSLNYEGHGPDEQAKLDRENEKARAQEIAQAESDAQKPLQGRS